MISDFYGTSGPSRGSKRAQTYQLGVFFVGQHGCQCVHKQIDLLSRLVIARSRSWKVEASHIVRKQCAPKGEQTERGHERCQYSLASSESGQSVSAVGPPALVPRLVTWVTRYSDVMHVVLLQVALIIAS